MGRSDGTVSLVNTAVAFYTDVKKVGRQPRKFVLNMLRIPLKTYRLADNYPLSKTVAVLEE